MSTSPDLLDMFYPECSRTNFEMTKDEAVNCARLKSRISAAFLVIVILIITYMVYDPTKDNSKVLLCSVAALFCIGFLLPRATVFSAGQKWEITNAQVNGYMKSNPGATRIDATKAVQAQDQINATNNIANQMSIQNNQRNNQYHNSGFINPHVNLSGFHMT